MIYETEHGIVLWRGGSGHPGTKGGWGFRCKHCNEGTSRGAAKSESKAISDFFAHLRDKHADKLAR